MAVVEVKVASNYYKISCQDGEENYLYNLIDKFSRRVEEAFANVKRPGADYMFLLTALKLEDQVTELSEKIKELNKELQQHQISNKENLQKAANTIVDYVAWRLERVFILLEENDKQNQ